MLLPRAIWGLKVHQNAFADGDLPRTPWGAYSAP